MQIQLLREVINEIIEKIDVREEKINNRELLKFTFPGKVIRDKNGKIMQLQF